MEENCETSTEQRLLQVISQQNERIQLLTTALNEKSALVDSLQKKILAVENQNDKNDSPRKQKVQASTIDIPEKSENSQPKDAHAHGTHFSTAVDKAFKNPMILASILKKQRTSHLLYNCRLVNRDFRDMSTDILLKRKNIHVDFVTDSFWKGGNFILSRNPLLTLSRLIDLLGGSASVSASTCKIPCLPCTNFSFNGNLSSSDAQTFLSRFGSNVKGLRVNGLQNLNCVRKTLAELLPNLQCLDLERAEEHVTREQDASNIQNQSADSSPLPIPIPILPSLTKLELGQKSLHSNSNSSLLVTDIVQAAPNLQHCSGFWSLQELHSLYPRIHVLKGLSWRPKGSRIETLEQLLEKPLQLSYLEMNEMTVLFMENDRAQLEYIHSKVVAVNQLTLVELKLVPAIGLLPIRWPEAGLKNVRKLTLVGVLKQLCVSTPVSKIFSIFPNLHTFCIKTSEIDRREAPRVSWRDDVYTVKSLILSLDQSLLPHPVCTPGHCGSILLSWLRIFPNISHLSLGRISAADFYLAAPVIWGIQDLKSLQLEIGNCDVDDIDSGFTGIEKSACRFLRSCTSGLNMNMNMDMDMRISDAEVEMLRRRSSILDLKELKELYLPQEYRGDLDSNVQTVSLVASFVSYKYAFNLHPKLRVYSHRFHEE